MIKTKQYIRDGMTSFVEKSKLLQRRMHKFFGSVNYSGYKYRKIYRVKRMIQLADRLKYLVV